MDTEFKQVVRPQQNRSEILSDFSTQEKILDEETLAAYMEFNYGKDWQEQLKQARAKVTKS